jgi:hypothetical protein
MHVADFQFSDEMFDERSPRTPSLSPSDAPMKVAGCQGSPIPLSKTSSGSRRPIASSPIGLGATGGGRAPV